MEELVKINGKNICKRKPNDLNIAPFGNKPTRKRCVYCYKHIYDNQFKSEESKKIFLISGVCQECQDKGKE